MPMRNHTIVAAEGTWVVRAGGAVIAESTRALELVRSGGVRVIYFPPDDVGMALLEGSATVAAREELGDARVFSILTASGVIPQAAWSYETPLEGAERIAGLIAFDDSRVTVEEV